MRSTLFSALSTLVRTPSRLLAPRAFVLLAVSTATLAPACSSGSEHTDAQASAVFGIDDIVVVYEVVSKAAEAYNKITSYLGDTPDPQAKVMKELAGLRAAMERAQAGLSQIQQEIKNLVYAEQQNFWDQRVSKANAARAQADSASTQLAGWLASGKTDGNLQWADNNSLNAANLIKDDETLFYRPATVAGDPEVFEYRMALPQYLYAVSVRLAVISQLHPNLKTEPDATAAPVRAELASHATRIAWVLNMVEAETHGSCWAAPVRYDNNGNYLACNSCKDMLSGAHLGAGGFLQNGYTPDCENWQAGSWQDGQDRQKLDLARDEREVYSQTGMLAVMAMRDDAIATSHLGFYGPAGKFDIRGNAWADPFYGAHGTLAGDVNGDGRADLVGLGDGFIGAILSRSDGTFGTYQPWWNGSFFGSHGTFLADVNNDKMADLVGVGDGYVGVILSNGTGFGSYQTWSTSPWAASTHGNLVGDVDGDGRADLVSLRDDYLIVLRSLGDTFAPARSWGPAPFFGSHGTFLADIDGDKRADLVGLGDGFIGVMRSTGTSFGAYETWWGNSFYGANDHTFLADVDGDGRADLVGLGSDQVGVIRSNGNTFGAYENWWSGNFNGAHGNQLADFDGDHRADLVGFENGAVPSIRSTHAY